jgi:hypothetical protein
LGPRQPDPGKPGQFPEPLLERFLNLVELPLLGGEAGGQVVGKTAPQTAPPLIEAQSTAGAIANGASR